MKNTIINISRWNVITNFPQIAGCVDGVIVKAGERVKDELVTDVRFFRYMEKLGKNNVPLGSSFETAAITEDEAREEADYFVGIVEKTGIRLSIPLFVYADYVSMNKNGRSDNLSVEERTAIIKAFIDQCNRKGYNCGLATKSSWINSKFIYDEVKDYVIWLDNNNLIDTIKNLVLYKLTNKYEVKGIAGFVEANKSTIDISEFNPYIEQPSPDEIIPDPIVEEAPEIIEDPVVEETIEEVVPETVEEVTEEPIIEEEPVKVEKKSKVYKTGDSIKLKDAELYKSSVSSTILRNLTGKFYIANERVLNSRIRVSESKDGNVIGWITI